MEHLIKTHLKLSEVDVYCGGTDKFHGKIMPNSTDGVLILKDQEGISTYIATDKIIAIWPRRK